MTESVAVAGAALRHVIQRVVVARPKCRLVIDGGETVGGAKVVVRSKVSKGKGDVIEPGTAVFER